MMPTWLEVSLSVLGGVLTAWVVIAWGMVQMRRRDRYDVYRNRAGAPIHRDR